jgi:hypothetical protein
VRGEVANDGIESAISINIRDFLTKNANLMTSIFLSSYQDNAKRIADSGLEKKLRPEINNIVRQDFGEILDNASKKTPPQLTLTNSLKYSPPAEEKKIVLSELEIAIDSPAHIIDSAELNSANQSSPTAQSLNSPPPTLPILGEPPAIPSIIKAQRTSTGTTLKPDKKAEIQEMISTAGKYYGIDPQLPLAIARAESNFDEKAISKDGHYSKGIFQLLDTTGQDMKARLDLDEKYDPFDAAQNTFLGVGYLKRLHDLFSDQNVLHSDVKTFAAKTSQDLEKLAVAAFNTGEGNVAEAQQKALALGKDPASFDEIEPFLPDITKKYVAKVSKYKKQS